MKANFGLMVSAGIKLLIGLVLVGLLIFLPAGTIRFFNGWLLIAVLFVPMLIAGVVMALRSPGLLRKRLNPKEKENEQKSVVAISGVMFVVAFMVAGFNYRYSWMVMPSWAVWCAVVLFLLSYLIYAEVLRVQRINGEIDGYGCQFQNVDQNQEEVFGHFVYTIQLQKRIEEQEKEEMREEALLRVKDPETT